MKDKILVFGRGKYYEYKKASVTEKYEIIAFLDNKVIEKQYECGTVVVNPSKWKEFPDNSKILLMAKDWYSMYLQLFSEGVPKERILFGMMENPCFDEMEELFQNNEISIKAYKGGAIKISICDNEEHVAKNYMEYIRILRKIYMSHYNLIKMIHDMPIRPSSRGYGVERGKSIDRVYIEEYLQKHSDKVQGVCLEIGDNTYTQRFGQNVEKSIVMHVYGEGENVIKGNFETGEGLEKNSYDCIICTQVLQAIFELRKSIKNIYKSLKPGGSVLITVSGAGGSPVSLNDYHNWGVYWRFTDLSLRRLLEEVFPPESVEIQAYGNVKTMMAFQYGMCAEELDLEDFYIYDEKYPMIIGAVATKK